MSETNKRAGFVAADTMTGGCECGATRYEIAAGAEINSVVACHCGQCNKATSHFLAATSVPDDKLNFTKDADLTVYQSSDFAERGFCGKCGSQIFWRLSDASNRTKTSLMAGSFDDQSQLKLDRHIFVDHKAPYYDMPDDGLPRYANGD